MAISVGKENLGIENPFKGLGRLLLLIGLLGLGCAAYLAREAIVSLDAQAPAAETAMRGAVALLLGLLALRLFWNGLMRVLRLYVGRDVPASLSEERDEHDGAQKPPTGGLAASYQYEEIERMLDGKEIAYATPKTLVGRLLYTLFPRLLYTPPPVRRFAENAFVPFLYALGLAGLYAACLAVERFGLLSFSEPAVLRWTAGVYGLLVARRWLAAFRVRDLYRADDKGLPLRRRGLMAALLAPVVLELIARSEETSLPAIPASAQLVLWTALGGSAALFALAVLLVRHRVPKEPLSYAASDERRNWEEDTHPADLFRIFTQIMLELRRRDIPNRCYFNQLEISSGIGNNQTAEKGVFKGKIAHETQPLAKEDADGADRRKIDGLLRVASVVGAAAIAAGFAGATAFAATFELNQALAGPDLPAAAANAAAWILSFATIAIVGEKMLLGLVQFFRSELVFESQLILFRGSGSFRTTKLTTGAGFNDSQRSESDLIHSSFSVRLIASRLVTSVFLKPARSAPFDTGRFVVEMERPGDLANSVLYSINEYLKGRRKLSTFTSKDDADTVSQLGQLNRPAQGEFANLLARRDGQPQQPLSSSSADEIDDEPSPSQAEADRHEDGADGAPPR